MNNNENADRASVVLVENVKISLDEYQSIISVFAKLFESEDDVRIAIWKAWQYLFKYTSLRMGTDTDQLKNENLIAESALSSELPDTEAFKAMLVKCVFLAALDNHSSGSKNGLTGILSSIFKLIQGKGTFFSGMMNFEVELEKIPAVSWDGMKDDFCKEVSRLFLRIFSEKQDFVKTGFFKRLSELILSISFFRWFASANAIKRGSHKVEIEDIEFAGRIIEKIYNGEKCIMESFVSGMLFSVILHSLTNRREIIASIVHSI
ncbi:MAG: hypothetical protein HQM10_22000 [Candidatus Riflebacteria bacterium]|nr:hypothetical protein [Candidatus Riflebacteria bacterium]